MKPRQSDEMDSPWKEAIEQFLGDFLSFFFPVVHAVIDWSKSYVSLDKELHRIVRDADVGKRLADKLFKVWQIDGQEAWLLIHIEVQGRRDEDFAERMFTYNCRTYDRYRRPVASLAVLCDTDPKWKPQQFGYNIGGCEVGIRFLVAKLIDYRGNDQALEQNPNPFAAVVLAQLKALETRKSPAERQTWKIRLIKGLYERGLAAEEIRQLFRLIDWLLVLPAELEQEFRAELDRFEEERNMPYVTSVERLAKEEGRQEGRLQGREEGREEGRQQGLREGLLVGIEAALIAKFSKLDKRLLQDLRAVKDVKSLRKLARALKEAVSLDDVRRLVH
jgi:hypothetical protein